MTRQATSHWIGAALALLLATAGCATSAGGTTNPSSPPNTAPVASASPGLRPSSPAVVAITEPAVGASLAGPTVHVVITLTGAQIVQATSTDVRPDQGHVHLYVNSQLVSMNYGLEQDISLQPGTYVLKAEFVASDHVPFNPRVWSPEVYIKVTG
jgi:hypothetical protein